MSEESRQGASIFYPSARGHRQYHHNPGTNTIHNGEKLTASIGICCTHLCPLQASPSSPSATLLHHYTSRHLSARIFLSKSPLRPICIQLFLQSGQSGYDPGLEARPHSLQLHSAIPRPPTSRYRSSSPPPRLLLQAQHAHHAHAPGSKSYNSRLNWQLGVQEGRPGDVRCGLSAGGLYDEPDTAGGLVGQDSAIRARFEGLWGWERRHKKDTTGE